MRKSSSRRRGPCWLFGVHPARRLRLTPALPSNRWHTGASHHRGIGYAGRGAIPRFLRDQQVGASIRTSEVQVLFARCRHHGVVDLR